MLVDVQSGAAADAGSIPAASIIGLGKRFVGVSSRNDSDVRLLTPPMCERLHVTLQVSEVTMAVDTERRGKVRVPQRMGSGVNSGDTPNLGRGSVPCSVHVESRAHTFSDEPSRFELSIPPPMNVLRAWLAFWIAPQHASLSESLDGVREEVVGLRLPSHPLEVCQ